MHTCFDVDEIVRLIARELIGSRGTATAVALACCCKSFEEPVLDVLWEAQYGLPQLFKTFPEDVWNEGSRSVSFKRLPTTMEWARFRKYARRMRKLVDLLDLISSEVISVIQICTNNEPLLPNLKSLGLLRAWESIHFIPLLLSPGTTSVTLGFNYDLPKAIVASMITTLPTLCPNLQKIELRCLPMDPMITTAVAGMFLATNPTTLQQVDVQSPLTREASEVIYKLSNLRSLSVTVEKGALLPSASLPNLTDLTMTCDDEGDWPRLFHRAEFGKLESVTFIPRSEQIGDFLGAFKSAALSSSIQNTLSSLRIYTSCSWNSNYSSLLPFTQLVYLEILSSCVGDCSSRINDNIVINLSQAMPKLEVLRLGDEPCRYFATGVTAKGLLALARHCQNLWALRIHFQVASLTALPVNAGRTSYGEVTAFPVNSALTRLDVGEMRVPEELVFMVTLTLLRIFPQVDCIMSTDEGWRKVEKGIYLSRRIIDCATPGTGS